MESAICDCPDSGERDRLPLDSRSEKGRSALFGDVLVRDLKWVIPNSATGYAALEVCIWRR